MVLFPTPRTVEAPPVPGSHILPTPGHTPVALAADVAAAALVDESTIDVPAIITAANANGNADLCILVKPLKNTLATPPVIGSATPWPKPAGQSYMET
jgi:hypothetical protein